MNRSEERLVRDAMVAISQRYGRDVLVMRNEANALTLFKERASSLLRAALRSSGLHHAAIEALGTAYHQLSPAIKYGLGVGSADVIVCAWGRFLALEFKAEKGRQSEEQKSYEGAVEMAGGRYYIVRSIEDAIAAVEACRA